MNRFDFSESMYSLGLQLFSCFACLSTYFTKVGAGFHESLALHGLLPEYFYFGILGQVLVTLIKVRERLNSEEIIIKLSLRKFLALLLGWLIAPILTVLFVSSLFPTYSLFYGLIALGLGAGFESLWDIIKGYSLDIVKAFLQKIVDGIGSNNDRGGRGGRS